MQIGELNARVTLKHYQTTQDSVTGKTHATLVNSWDKWAKVEQKGGSRSLDNAAINYTENYTITIRYEVSRPTLTNYNLNYKGKEMKIYRVEKQQEGFLWYEILSTYL